MVEEQQQQYEGKPQFLESVRLCSVDSRKFRQPLGKEK